MVSLLRVPAFNLTARSLREVSWLVCVSFLSLGLHAVAQAEPVAGKDFSVLATPQAVETPGDRKSTRLNSSHSQQSRMPSSA